MSTTDPALETVVEDADLTVEVDDDAEEVDVRDAIREAEAEATVRRRHRGRQAEPVEPTAIDGSWWTGNVQRSHAAFGAAAREREARLRNSKGAYKLKTPINFV
jgi:hypothetical protein